MILRRIIDKQDGDYKGVRIMWIGTEEGKLLNLAHVKYIYCANQFGENRKAKYAWVADLDTSYDIPISYFNTEEEGREKRIQLINIIGKSMGLEIVEQNPKVSED